MRKIEEQMIKAISTGRPFNKSNTQVLITGNGAKIYLHGNLIAKITPNEYTLSNAGWATNTTHSRLRAIVKHLNLDITIKGKQEDTLFITPNETFYNWIEV